MIDRTHELARILRNRSWLRCNYPFPHVIATDVFQTDFYEALASQLGEILSRGLNDTATPGRFARNIAGYDAYGLGFGPGTDGPLSVFLSAAWRNMLCEIFAIGPTPYVFVGSHHHLPGSSPGFIHNDFNPVWFPQAGTAEIRTPDSTLCSYKTGVGRLGEGEKIQVSRGAVLLFYLLNDAWGAGDGGETALYTSASDLVDKPTVKYPPVNNSLVAFECTPQSFHTFLGNTHGPRTSLIIWVHRTMDEAIARYGENHLEGWVT